MKRIIKVAAFALCCIVLSGCACEHEWKDATCTEPKTCTKCGEIEGEPLNEEDFYKSLSTGLENRWKLTLADEGNDFVSEEDWSNYFNAEYDEISKFADANFNNSEIADLAKHYVEVIEQSKKCLPYLNTDFWESKYVNGVYHDRAETLYKINSIKPIIVTEEFQSTLQNILIEGEVINVVKDMIDNVQFELVSDEYGWKTYQAIVENTSPVDFNQFWFNIDLIDEDGVTLETISAYVDKWDVGEKTKFTFNTDEEFVTLSVEYANWYY